MSQYSLLSDDDIPQLASGVLTVLDEVGILCENEEMLTKLDEAGARVDYDNQRVRFPRPMTAEFVESFRQESSRSQEVLRFAAPALPTLGTQVAQLYYDYPQHQQRTGNKEDFIHLLKLGDVLHPAEGVGHCLLLTEVPPMIEPLEAAMLLAEYAHQPKPAFAWNVRQVNFLAQMGEILGIVDWFEWGAICIAHPLRFDRDVADKFVRRVNAGTPTGLTAMPVAGATTPVTVEGFIVVASAELIAGWIAARVLNPEVGLVGSMWAGTVDMKTGTVSYCAFDAMYYAFACVEFVRRWCGMTVSVGGGEYCDAKVPGLYTALEKAYKAMTIAAFTGQLPCIGQGMLAEGKTISPVQLLLERDLATGLQSMHGALDPTPEKMGLSAIRRVDLGLHTSHLETEHTLSHFRHCLWLPELIERAGWAGPDAESQVLDKTQEKVDSLVAQYSKPEGRGQQLTAMRAVVEKAKADLCA